MSCRCRVDQGNRDIPSIPVPDVSAALDVPDFDFQLRQMIDDSLPVMPEPVRAVRWQLRSSLRELRACGRG